MTSSTGPPGCACAGVGQGKHRERIVFSAMVFFVGWLAGVAFCYCCFVLLPMVFKEVGRVEGEGFDVWDKVSVWWCLFVKRE